MDNLATHKVAGVREAIEAVGAYLLYLPPYSPDFNPIENMWSKIKQLLRSLAPRTAEDLLRAAALAFASVSKADCRGGFYMPNALYDIWICSGGGLNPQGAPAANHCGTCMWRSQSAVSTFREHHVVGTAQSFRAPFDVLAMSISGVIC